MKNFITDVDGVLTDGSFYYNETGKVFKKFGAHDSDGFKIIKSLNINTCAISADKRGFGITEKRLSDMDVPIHLVSEDDRFNWVSQRFNLNETVFVGDGYHDRLLLSRCALSFAPQNSPKIVKDSAKIVTSNRGGEGVILEIALHLQDILK